MPKDNKSSRSNKSHDFVYKPYSRAADSSKAHDDPAEWEDVNCPICMESPHNAVLLLCSSHTKGCRPYMCDTSYRHSNCLDQYLKKSTPSEPQGTFSESGGTGGFDDQEYTQDGRFTKAQRGLNLVCPLCRGSVAGWKVVERARKYLDNQRRGCAQDSCRYSGAYEELRKHARFVHPLARPSEVDPDRQRDWFRLENQRDIGDVISSIESSIPNATVVGDYVLEDGDEYSDPEGSDTEQQLQPHHHHHHPVAHRPDVFTMLLLFQFMDRGSSQAATGGNSTRHHFHQHHVAFRGGRPSSSSGTGGTSGIATSGGNVIGSSSRSRNVDDVTRNLDAASSPGFHPGDSGSGRNGSYSGGRSRRSMDRSTRRRSSRR